MDIAPAHTATPGYHRLTWDYPEAKVEIEAKRVKSDSRDGLKASVSVAVTRPAQATIRTTATNLSLMAGRSRRDLVHSCEQRFPLESVNWDWIIEDSCGRIMEQEEQGSPAERLRPATSTAVKYMLGRVVLDGLPILTFGPGGQFKSFLSIYKALLIENGLPFMGEETAQANALILDWEVNRAEAERRCDLLINGLMQKHIGADIRRPFYRHCVGPIHNETSEIAKVIAEHEIRFVVVDSAGLACGGDVASSELAIQFFNTLRKVTSYTEAATDIQTHTTKADRKEENQRRLPIGSIYWENLARITWEIRSERERPGVHKIGLFPRKCNMGDLEPVGLRMTFDRDALVVEEAAATDVSTEQGAIRTMILTELENGPCGPSELAEAIGTTAGMVSKTLTHMKDRGLVENVARGMWARTDESYRGKNDESYR